MKVLINAISIVEGGGIVVLKKLLDEMSQLDTDVKWYVAAKPATLEKISVGEAFIPMPFLWANKTPLHHLFWYEYTLPKILRDIKADVCFSQTNFLPSRSLSCPSILLVQHAGYFSEKFEALHFNWNNNVASKFLWNKKKNWVARSIKQSTVVTVQTQALAQNIINKLNIKPEKTAVIPHGTGLITQTVKSRKYPYKTVWRIGYITKFGVQKDFITAIKAVSILSQSIPIKLVLTLDPKTAEFPAVWSLICQNGIEKNIENHGEISNSNEIKNLYESLDIFIFPSLCESFGFTLIEAMGTGLPVIAADTDSNREIVGNPNYLFKAENPKHLAEKLMNLIDNSLSYEQASIDSLERSRQFCWKKTAKELLTLIHQVKKEC